MRARSQMPSINSNFRRLAFAPTLQAKLEANGNRGPGFDTVRLLAASAVMLHHALGIEIDIVRDDVIFQFSGGYTHLGLVAVAVFFSISGFLVAPGLKKSRNVLEYLSRRFMRIMPLLFVVVAFTALVLGPLLTSLTLAEYFSQADTWAYLRNITTSLRLDLPGVENHTGGSEVNSPLWTLRYEWLCYIILAFASVGLLMQTRVFFAAFWMAIIIAFPAIYGFAEAGAGTGQIGMLLYLFGYFGAGVVLCLYADVIRWSVPLMLIALATLIAVLYVELSHIFAPILVTYVAVGIGVVRFPWSSILSRADFSYGIYLTHSLILTLLMSIYHFTSSLALFAACLIFSVLVAWLTWTFVEKPALELKSLPAQVTRTALQRVPFGLRLLSWLEPSAPRDAAPQPRR